MSFPGDAALLSSHHLVRSGHRDAIASQAAEVVYRFRNRERADRLDICAAVNGPHLRSDKGRRFLAEQTPCRGRQVAQQQHDHDPRGDFSISALGNTALGKAGVRAVVLAESQILLQQPQEEDAQKAPASVASAH